MIKFLSPLLALIFFSLSSLNFANDLHPKIIESISGLKGHLEKDQSYKITTPRDDLKINVNGVKITPAMGLSSWISFRPVGKEVFLQGDLVLTADQINPIMNLVLKNDVQITALQNHLLWENPQVVVMHVECVSTEKNLALIVNKIFSAIKATSEGKGDFPFADMQVTDTTLDAPRLNKLLGLKGTIKDGVYKVNVNNPEADLDEENPKHILNVSAAFVGSNDEAAVDGNFMVDQTILQRTLIALNKVGIYIVGIHTKLSENNNHSVSIHYWGVGSTKNLAKGIRNVLDLQDSTED